MKKCFPLLLVFVMAFTTQAQIINIPDANFKARLLAAGPTNTTAANSANVYITIDTNNNNEIELSEALQVSSLNISIADIYDTTGIEYFTNLRWLNCSQNHFPVLNVSTLVNLKSLYCSLNLLSSLNLSGLTHLLTLECAENVLTQITFADAVNIQSLSCRFNFLTNLDVAALPNLHTLNCDYNQLTTINLSNSVQLTDLGCQSNQLTSLDLSSLVNLTALNCSFNQLTALDLTGLDTISTLNCAHNQITALDLANLSLLTLLNCEANLISNTLVLNGMPALQSVYCHDNLIPAFTLTDLPGLQILDCSANPMTTLDTSQLPELSLLNCYNNPMLTDLNIKNGSNESFLDFSNNPSLQNVCADEAQLNDVQNLITQYGYTNCQANSLCDLATPHSGAKVYCSLYPVPVKTNLYLNLPEGITLTSLTVYDVLGQVVLTLPKAVAAIDVSQLQNGIYCIKVTTDKGSTNVKFIKE
ncbi:T9SS type A sorting domain-containing protein [Flavobacterium sp. XGLA_31]|uniref:T9SS type A sorting domain-containing protein n=1 Tax=Flavobacterium sp. XGLA_31 TaxID=3447666 RepID=UPI003F33E9B7